MNFEWNIFMDINILYEKFFIITKYSLISNSNVNTDVTDMNNIESSTDSDSINKEYNINNKNIIITIEIINVSNSNIINS
jgi:hypothetical protein